MFSNVEERVRQRAYEIWQREGCPEGRSEENWTLAKEEIAIEDNQQEAMESNPVKKDGKFASRSEPVEPASSMAIQGDMPGLRDQGDEQPAPRLEPVDRSGQDSPKPRRRTLRRLSPQENGKPGRR